MTKKIRFINLIAVMLFSNLFTWAYNTPAQGNGSASNPFKLYTYEDLFGYVAYVNATTANGSACAIMMNDIDITNRKGPSNYDGWEPISFNGGYSESKPYTGTFDGNGKTIYGLKIYNKTYPTYQVGLVSWNGGIIRNLTIECVYVDSGTTSLFAYTNLGKISNCVAKSPEDFYFGHYRSAAAFVIENKGIIENCCNKMNMKKPHDGEGPLIGAGFVHNNYGKISDCVNEGIINIQRAAGIVTYNSPNGIVERCLNKAAISGEDAGGIASHSTGLISDCMNVGKISDRGIKTVGAIAGISAYYGGGVIKNCFNSGDITSSFQAGCIVANNGSGVVVAKLKVENCHFPSSVIMIIDGDRIPITDKSGEDEYIKSETTYYCHDPAVVKSGRVTRFLNGGGWLAERNDGAFGQVLHGSGKSDQPQFMTADKSNAVYRVFDTAMIPGGLYGNDKQTVSLPTTISQKYYNVNIFDGSFIGYKDVYTTQYTIDGSDADLKAYGINMNSINHSEMIDGKTFFRISNGVELDWFCYYVNNYDAGANAILTADIDLVKDGICNASTGKQWTPIGSSSFTGIFDGNGKSINGLYINQSTLDCRGFMKISSGTIKNLTLTGEVTGRDDASLLVGENSGTIYNCTLRGKVTGRDRAGGAAGRNSGSISCVNNHAQIKGSHPGGICGMNDKDITECTNRGEVIGQSAYTGGIVAYHRSGTLFNCANYANISGGDKGSRRSDIGGVAGYLDGGASMSNCFSSGDLVGIYDSYWGSTPNIGALGGYVESNSSVTNCHFSSSVKIIINNIAQQTVYGEGGYNVGERPDRYKKHEASALASGKVTRLLNGDKLTAESASGAWGQILHGDATDNLPQIMTADNGNAVCQVMINGEPFLGNPDYVIALPCAANDAARYNNTYITNGVYTDGTKTYDYTYSIAKTDATLTPSAGGYDMADRMTTIDGNPYYLISNGRELDWFRYYVNLNTTNKSINAQLTADIDLMKDGICDKATNKQWTLIATDSSSPFKGIFDGNNKKISGLYINNKSALSTAFITSLGGVVKNLEIDADITMATAGSVIVARNVNGLIENCIARGSVVSSSMLGLYHGGIVAENYSKIINCTNYATISGLGYMGGISGLNNGEIRGCTNYTDINSTSTSTDSGVAGIIGKSSKLAILSDCRNYGNMSSSEKVGGIIAWLEGAADISNCYSTGNITRKTSAGLKNAGLIVGLNNNVSSVKNCHYLSTATLTINDAVSTPVGEGRNSNGRPLTACYYAQTPADMANGKITRLLNGGDGTTQSSEGFWGQTIDAGKEKVAIDPYPSFMSSDKQNTVYRVLAGDAPLYGNDNKIIVLPTQSTPYSETMINIAYSDEKGSYSGSFQIQGSDATLSATSYDMALRTEMIDGKSFYQISNGVELDWFRYYVNHGNTTSNAILTADIDLAKDGICDKATNLQWGIISTTLETQFIGTIDGGNKKVTGLYINRPEEDNIGFISRMTGILKNLSVAGEVQGKSTCGILTAYNLGTIENCSTAGSLIASGNDAAGIAGINHNKISRSHNSATVKGNESQGGVAGSNWGHVSDISNSGDITGTTVIGGIVGYNHNSGTVQNTLNTGNQTGATVTGIGAIIGRNDNGKEISNSHYLSTGTITVNGSVKTLIPDGSTTSITSVYHKQTPEDLASGRVARLLNGANGTNETPVGAWGQALTGETIDSCPVLIANKAIYTVTTPDGVIYGNEAQTVSIPLKSKKYEGTIIRLGYRDESNNPLGLTYAVPARDSQLAYNSYDMADAKHRTEIDGKTYYQISNGMELEWFSAYINESINNRASNAILTACIDLVADGICNEETNQQWTPIATIAYGYDVTGFKYSGIFDGADNTISGLYINNAEKPYVGLFGITEGTIKNLTINGTLVGGINSAIIAGFNTGTINNCTTIGTLCGSTYTGSVAGTNKNGVITNCINDALITGGSALGGVIGINLYGRLGMLRNTASVTGLNNVGGIIGSNSGSSPDVDEVTDISNSGDIKGNKTVGGLVGFNGGCISRGRNIGNVGRCAGYPEDTYADFGGIIGRSQGDYTVSCVFNTGNVTGSFLQAGGVAGYSSSNIIHAYNSGHIKGGKYVGGIIGYSWNYYLHCLNVGDITGSDMLGAIVGSQSGSGLSTINNHYNASGIMTKNNVLVEMIPQGNANISVTYFKHTPEELKSGVVARLLNGGNGTKELREGVWGQTLSGAAPDAHPIFMLADNSNQVYAAKKYSTLAPMGINEYRNSFIEPNTSINEIAYTEDVFAANVLPLNLIARNASGAYEANEISFNDNHDIVVPNVFAARKASIEYTPVRYASRTSGGIANLGYDGLVVPFNGYLCINDERKEPFYDKEAKDGGNFWLSEFDFYVQITPEFISIKYATKSQGNYIRKDTPYLLSLPGETFSPELSAKGKTITIEGDNVNIGTSTEEKWQSTYWVMTPSMFGKKSSLWQLDDTGSKVVKGKTETDIAPFRITYHSNFSRPEGYFAGESLPTGVDDADALSGMKIYTSGGKLIIETPADVELPVYAIDGTLIRIITAAEGRTIIDNLPTGAYIVGRTKAIIQ